MAESHLEAMLRQRIEQSGWFDEAPLQEYRFCPSTRHRADFAWPSKRILIEVEGGVWTKGRHTRGAGYSNDCQKYNLAVLEGWRVFRFTREMIASGAAIKTLRAAYTQEGWND